MIPTCCIISEILIKMGQIAIETKLKADYKDNRRYKSNLIYQRRGQEPWKYPR